MVDVKATNEKLSRLRQRACIVIQGRSVTKALAVSTLKTTDYDVKLSILMILTKDAWIGQSSALDQQHGFLRKAVENNQ